MDAVNLAPKLDLYLPKIPEEWDKIFEQYKTKSTNEITAGCVEAIDGLFQHTNKSTSFTTYLLIHPWLRPGRLFAKFVSKFDVPAADTKFRRRILSHIIFYTLISHTLAKLEVRVIN